MLRTPLSALFALTIGLQAKETDEARALAPYRPPPAPNAANWPNEKLRGFLRELVEFVEKRHVVTDPQRKTYGMVYEFWKDGKQIQEFGLDAMHDGAWFMSALVTAQRADPANSWLSRAQRFQVPFYTNVLLNSDRLFPKMQPTPEERRPWSSPTKGWLPRGWDDGRGTDRKTGQLLADGYFSGSNHLAQDAADALLNVWLSTRDPRVAAALRALHEAKLESYGPIQGLAIGAAVASGEAGAFLRFPLPGFTPEAMNPYYTGFFQQMGNRLPSYDDGLGWMYRQATAGAQISGEFPAGFGSYAIARCAGYQAALEQFFDDAPYRYGVYFFDLQRAPGILEGKGKLEHYASTSRNFYGARGVQISWIAAGLLPELKSRPELWDGTVAPKFSSEPRVPIVDEGATTDGEREAGYVRLAQVEGAEVSLLSDPRHLHLFVQTAKPEITLTFQHAGPVSGEARIGKITLRSDGSVTAANDKGERLLAASVFKAGETWSAELRIPYSVVPTQGQWINGVDHGRYHVAANGGKSEFVYFLSPSARIRHRLENLALGTIDYWHGVWKQAGMIPSGWSAPTASAGSWEMSDAGNCAHLIKAIALWLIYQEGEREWAIIRREFPSEPKGAPVLPRSVLQAQGLLPTN